MEHEHLTQERLAHLLSRPNDQVQNRNLLHLLAICPRCQTVGGWILDLYQAGAVGDDFCTLELELARSRAEAPALLEELQQLPAEEQTAQVCEDPRFRSWGLCELLCAESEVVAARDAEEAVHLAELAVALSETLQEGEPAEESWLCELRALASASLGNARRVLGELRSAEEAFARADDWWPAGSGGAENALGYQARFLDLLASLRRDQRRLTEALELLNCALAADEGGALKGRILVKKAKTIEEMGDLHDAIGLLDQAEAAVSPAGDPRLLYSISHNRVDYLSKLERWAEAEALLPAVEAQAVMLGHELSRLRLLWVAGRIAAGLGRVEEATEALKSVRQSFAARGIGYDTALVSLELATVLARQGRVAEVKVLAQEVVPLFQAQDIHREVLIALMVFRQAAEAEALTADLAALLTDLVARARHDSGPPCHTGT